MSDIDELLGSIDDKGALIEAAKESVSAVLVHQEPDGDWVINVHSITRAEASFAKVLIHEFIAKDMGLRNDEEDDE